MRGLLAVLVVSALVQAPAAAGWSWPVDGPVLRPFVLGNDPYAAGQHRGIDIGADIGATVRAAAGGSVSFVGTVPARGRAVTVRTADGLSVTYLELGATQVERGAAVSEGDAIGTIGSASHVHLGVRVTADEHGYLDPLQFLPARVTGPARADPVPEPAAVVHPQPVAEAVVRAQPPSAETPSTPTLKPEPGQAAPAPPPPATQVASVPPPQAPAAEQPHDAPVSAEATRLPATAESFAPSRGRARAPADQAEPLRKRASRAPEPIREASGPLDGRLPRAAAATPRRQGARRSRSKTVEALPPARPVEPKPATRRAGKDSASEAPREARRPVGRSDSERSVAPKLLLASLVLLFSVAGAVTSVLHRRRRGASVVPSPAGTCSVGRLRPPRLLHACVRAREAGWHATAARSRSLIAPHGPLPRPRRRVPVRG